MPTNTFAAAATPTVPPIPSVPRSTRAKARTTAGRMPTWNSSADNAAVTSTIGSARKASTKLAAGSVCANGIGPPPR